jgi:hypothetical protein
VGSNPTSRTKRGRMQKVTIHDIPVELHLDYDIQKNESILAIISSCKNCDRMMTNVVSVNNELLDDYKLLNNKELSNLLDVTKLIDVIKLTGIFLNKKEIEFCDKNCVSTWVMCPKIILKRDDNV